MFSFCFDSFYTSGRLFWGTDRMFLVQRALGCLEAEPERLVAAPQQPSSAKLTFFFDYASPWSYLASERLEWLLQSVAPVQVTVEWVPVLVGALFKKIGTPVVSHWGSDLRSESLAELYCVGTPSTASNIML